VPDSIQINFVIHRYKLTQYQYLQRSRLRCFAIRPLNCRLPPAT